MKITPYVLSAVCAAFAGMWLHSMYQQAMARKYATEPPAVINWVDLPVQDPATSRAMLMQVGLRGDGVVTWRSKP